MKIISYQHKHIFPSFWIEPLEFTLFLLIIKTCYMFFWIKLVKIRKLFCIIWYVVAGRGFNSYWNSQIVKIVEERKFVREKKIYLRFKRMIKSFENCILSITNLNRFLRNLSTIFLSYKFVKDFRGL